MRTGPYSEKNRQCPHFSFFRPYKKHGRRIVEFIAAFVYSGRDLRVRGDVLISDGFQKSSIPCGAGMSADRKLAFDGLTLLQRPAGERAVRMLGGKLRKIFITAVMSVIGVKIQQDAAAFEDAEPLRISLLRVGRVQVRLRVRSISKVLSAKAGLSASMQKNFAEECCFAASSLA